MNVLNRYNEEDIRLTKKQQYVWQFFLVAYTVIFLIGSIIAGKPIKFWIFTEGACLMIFPFLYCLSDVIAEIYGYGHSRVASITSFAFAIFMVIVFQLADLLPILPEFDGAANFSALVASSPRLLLASYLAFFIGDWTDDLVFARFRQRYIARYGIEKFNKGKGFFVRALSSSIPGEFIDAASFYTMAFAGILPFSILFPMTLSSTVLKLGYEAISFPVSRGIVSYLRNEK